MSRANRLNAAGAVAALCIAALSPAHASAPGTAAPRPILVALRYDDCSARSPAGLEDSILAACARRAIPVTFGVIPEPDLEGSGVARPEGALFPPDRASRLAAAARAGLLEIALHGCTHRALAGGGKSEFAGLDARRQDSLIARGLALLRPLEPAPRTFIPPWNAYDRSTLEALARNGIRTLSAIAGGDRPAGGSAAALSFVPATCLFPEMRSAVAEARRRGGGIIVPYIHPYEFKEIDSRRGLFTFARFDSTLAWLASQPDVAFATLGEIGESPAARPGAYAAYSRWHVLTPPGLERWMRPAYRVYPLAGFPVAGGGFWLRLAIMSGYLAAALPAYALARFLARSGRKSPAAGSRPGPLRTLSAVIGAIAIGIGILAPHPFALLGGLSLWAAALGYRRARDLRPRVTDPVRSPANFS